MINFNDNVNLNAPKNLDNSKGIWDAGAWRAYNSKAEVLANINIAYRYLTLTVPIKIGGVTSSYWFRDAVALESDLVVLATGGGGGVTPEIITVTGSTPIVLNWQTDIVPSGGVTWYQKFGNFRPAFLAEDTGSYLYNATSTVSRTGATINSITLSDLFAGLITVSQ